MADNQQLNDPSHSFFEYLCTISCPERSSESKFSTWYTIADSPIPNIFHNGLTDSAVQTHPCARTYDFTIFTTVAFRNKCPLLAAHWSRSEVILLSSHLVGGVGNIPCLIQRTQQEIEYLDFKRWHARIQVRTYNTPAQAYFSCYQQFLCFLVMYRGVMSYHLN